jgi:hypothetical protein
VAHLGPVASSLWWAARTSCDDHTLAHRARYDLGANVVAVLHGAAGSLGLPGVLGPAIADVFSEAIEAAEALRL